MFELVIISTGCVKRSPLSIVTVKYNSKFLYLSNNEIKYG